MKKIILIITILCSVQFQMNAQTWKKLHNAPSIKGKQDDLFFINTETGWSVNGQGKIFKTTDGGEQWDTLVNKPGTYFRCIAFTDSLKGFAGNIGTDYYPGVTDTIPLYQTFDGGKTWNPVSNINGPVVKGICNLFILDKTHIYGVGRVGGPCFIIKSNDGGNSWTSQELNKEMGMLIDCKFFSSDTGYIFGCSNNNNSNGRSLILGTTDGGKTWQEKFISKDTMELCWKASFPSSKVGYVSVLSYDSTSTFIKTIDGGITWNEYRMIDVGYEAKGVGFINENVGWIAGEGIKMPAYKTTDGGKTWQADHSLGPYINRFRFINNKVGYAIGASIYKMEINQK